MSESSTKDDKTNASSPPHSPVHGTSPAEGGDGGRDRHRTEMAGRGEEDGIDSAGRRHSRHTVVASSPHRTTPPLQRLSDHVAGGESSLLPPPSSTARRLPRRSSAMEWGHSHDSAPSEAPASRTSFGASVVPPQRPATSYLFPSSSSLSLSSPKKAPVEQQQQTTQGGLLGRLAASRISPLRKSSTTTHRMKSVPISGGPPRAGREEGVSSEGYPTLASSSLSSSTTTTTPAPPPLRAPSLPSRVSLDSTASRHVLRSRHSSGVGGEGEGEPLLTSPSNTSRAEMERRSPVHSLTPSTTPSPPRSPPTISLDAPPPRHPRPDASPSNVSRPPRPMSNAFTPLPLSLGGKGHAPPPTPPHPTHLPTEEPVSSHEEHTTTASSFTSSTSVIPFSNECSSDVLSPHHSQQLLLFLLEKKKKKAAPHPHSPSPLQHTRRKKSKKKKPHPAPPPHHSHSPSNGGSPRRSSPASSHPDHSRSDSSGGGLPSTSFPSGGPVSPHGREGERRSPAEAWHRSSVVSSHESQTSGHVDSSMSVQEMASSMLLRRSPRMDTPITPSPTDPTSPTKASNPTTTTPPHSHPSRRHHRRSSEEGNHHANRTLSPSHAQEDHAVRERSRPDSSDPHSMWGFPPTPTPPDDNASPKEEAAHDDAWPKGESIRFLLSSHSDLSPPLPSSSALLSQEAEAAAEGCPLPLPVPMAPSTPSPFPNGGEEGGGMEGSGSATGEDLPRAPLSDGTATAVPWAEKTNHDPKQDEEEKNNNNGADDVGVARLHEPQVPPDGASLLPCPHGTTRPSTTAASSLSSSSSHSSPLPVFLSRSASAVLETDASPPPLPQDAHRTKEEEEEEDQETKKKNGDAVPDGLGAIEPALSTRVASHTTTIVPASPEDTAAPHAAHLPSPPPSPPPQGRLLSSSGTSLASTVRLLPAEAVSHDPSHSPPLPAPRSEERRVGDTHEEKEARRVTEEPSRPPSTPRRMDLTEAPDSGDAKEHPMQSPPEDEDDEEDDDDEEEEVAPKVAVRPHFPLLVRLRWRLPLGICLAVLLLIVLTFAYYGHLLSVLHDERMSPTTARGREVDGREGWHRRSSPFFPPSLRSSGIIILQEEETAAAADTNGLHQGPSSSSGSGVVIFFLVLQLLSAVLFLLSFYLIFTISPGKVPLAPWGRQPWFLNRRTFIPPYPQNTIHSIVAYHQQDGSSSSSGCGGGGGVCHPTMRAVQQLPPLPYTIPIPPLPSFSSLQPNLTHQAAMVQNMTDDRWTFQRARKRWREHQRTFLEAETSRQRKRRRREEQETDLDPSPYIIRENYCPLYDIWRRRVAASASSAASPPFTLVVVADPPVKAYDSAAWLAEWKGQKKAAQAKAAQEARQKRRLQRGEAVFEEDAAWENGGCCGCGEEEEEEVGYDEEPFEAMPRRSSINPLFSLSPSSPHGHVGSTAGDSTRASSVWSPASGTSFSRLPSTLTASPPPRSREGMRHEKRGEPHRPSPWARRWRWMSQRFVFLLCCCGCCYYCRGGGGGPPPPPPGVVRREREDDNLDGPSNASPPPTPPPPHEKEEMTPDHVPPKAVVPPPPLLRPSLSASPSCTAGEAEGMGEEIGTFPLTPTETNVFTSSVSSSPPAAAPSSAAAVPWAAVLSSSSAFATIDRTREDTPDGDGQMEEAEAAPKKPSVVLLPSPPPPTHDPLGGHVFSHPRADDAANATPTRPAHGSSPTRRRHPPRHDRPPGHNRQRRRRRRGRGGERPPEAWGWSEGCAIARVAACTVCHCGGGGGSGERRRSTSSSPWTHPTPTTPHSNTATGAQGSMVGPVRERDGQTHDGAMHTETTAGEHKNINGGGATAEGTTPTTPTSPPFRSFPYIYLEQVNPYYVTIKEPDGDYRYCYDCHLYKPDLGYHCRACRHCVYNFDHHCPYVDKCIGRNNYRTFISFLLYATVASGLNFIFPLLSIAILDHRDGGSKWAWLIGPILSMLLCVFLGRFLIKHLILIHQGRTTMEKIIQKRKVKSARENGLPPPADPYDLLGEAGRKQKAAVHQEVLFGPPSWYRWMGILNPFPWRTDRSPTELFPVLYLPPETETEAE